MLTKEKIVEVLKSKAQLVSEFGSGDDLQAICEKDFEETTKKILNLDQPDFTEPKWVVFSKVGESASEQTGIYDVRHKKSNALVGQVRWWGGFHGYCFFSDPGGVIFDEITLSDIRRFINTLMRLHNNPKEKDEERGRGIL